MNFLNNWFKSQTTKVLTGLFAGLTLVFSLTFTDVALANSYVSVSPLAILSTKAEPTIKPEQVVNSVDTSIQSWLDEIKLSYDKYLQGVNQIITELPQQLAGGPTNGKSLEDKQDLLENAADKIDDLGEKVAKFNKRLQRSGTTLTTQVQNNIQNLQQSLEDSAEAINLLADDTERAKKGASTFLQTRIKQQLDIVKQALQASTQAFKVL